MNLQGVVNAVWTTAISEIECSSLKKDYVYLQYSYCHENGSFSLQCFNQHYLSHSTLREPFSGTTWYICLKIIQYMYELTLAN